MNANEYQKAALRTAQTERFASEQLLLNAALGLCGEAGEVSDMVKKNWFQGHDLDIDHIAKELGDIAWYLAVGAYAIGYNLDDVFAMNIEKLKKRYPNGFESARSIHREEGDI